VEFEEGRSGVGRELVASSEPLVDILDPESWEGEVHVRMNCGNGSECIVQCCCDFIVTAPAFYQSNFQPSRVHINVAVSWCRWTSELEAQPQGDQYDGDRHQKWDMWYRSVSLEMVQKTELNYLRALEEPFWFKSPICARATCSQSN
jgi:hypothetical protein